MNRTNIEWVKNPDGSKGMSWNPITGCLNGCDYCYARKLANGRLKSRYLANKNWCTDTPQLAHDHYPNLDPFYPRFWPERFDDLTPFNHELKPRGIFVCDMSDLFGISIPDDWTKRVMETIYDHPEHRFYLLTKQPQNLIKWSPFPDNCWVGVTATDDPMMIKAIQCFREVNAKIKYISFEPLLNGINPFWLDTMFKDAGIKWVIIGSQTKPYKLPKIEWVREIVEACYKANIPLFMKNNLLPLIEANKIWPELGVKLRQEMPDKEK